MSGLESVRKAILDKFAEAEADIDRPSRVDAAWWLDIRHGGRRITVEWRPRRGYGITARKVQFGEGADEVCRNAEETARRVITLLRSGESTRDPRAKGHVRLESPARAAG